MSRPRACALALGEGAVRGERALRVDRDRLRGTAAAEPLARLDDHRQQAARPKQASHSLPVSEVVSRPLWRPGSSVASTIIATGNSEMPSALSSGDESPLAGSRRLVSALKTVPRPMTTNVIVSDAVGTSVFGSSGPATSGISAATNSVAA